MAAGLNASSSRHTGSVRTLATGTILSFGGEIGRVTVNYVFGIVVARALGVENYGVYFPAFTIFNLLSLFSYSAIEDALMRFLGMFRRSSLFDASCTAPVDGEGALRRSGTRHRARAATVVRNRAPLGASST